MIFTHKAVVSSLSKLSIKSKNFFYKSCSVWYAIWECFIKSKGNLSFGQKAVDFITINQALNQKTSFTNDAQIGMLSESFEYKVQL